MSQEIPSVWVWGVGAQLCQGSCCEKRPGWFWLLPLGSKAEPAPAAPGASVKVHLRKGREVPGSREWGKSCEKQPWEQQSQRMRQERRCWSTAWFHPSAVRVGSVSSQPITGVMPLCNITNFSVNKAEIHTNVVLTVCNFAFVPY